MTVERLPVPTPPRRGHCTLRHEQRPPAHGVRGPRRPVIRVGSTATAFRNRAYKVLRRMEALGERWVSLASDGRAAWPPRAGPRLPGIATAPWPMGVPDLEASGERWVGQPAAPSPAGHALYHFWFSISFIASLGWVCALSAISLILVCCWLLFNVLSGSLAVSGRLASGLEQLKRKPAAMMMTTPRSHCLAVHAAELYDLCPAALMAVGEDW